MSGKRGPESEGQVVTRHKAREETRPPRPYKVILHNDDYTTMDFVVAILQSVFGKSHAEAHRLMLQVHQEGSCVAGVYPFEIAETKAAQVIAAAQAKEFPFLATVEPAE